MLLKNKLSIAKLLLVPQFSNIKLLEYSKKIYSLKKKKNYILPPHVLVCNLVGIEYFLQFEQAA